MIHLTFRGRLSSGSTNARTAGMVFNRLRSALSSLMASPLLDVLFAWMATSAFRTVGSRISSGLNRQTSISRRPREHEIVPPNPRLQRTGVRSPLSRQPLGAFA